MNCIQPQFQVSVEPAGLVLPVLGALPDALIIGVSGLGGSREEVAQQVGAGPGFVGK